MLAHSLYASIILFHASIIGLFCLDNKKKILFLKKFVVISCICAVFVVNLRRKKVIDMNKIVVLAEEGEVSLIDKLYEQLGIDLRNIPILYTGVGAINVIRALQELPRETEIFNIGYAGSANFEVGSWAEVQEVRLNHPNVTYNEPQLLLVEGQQTQPELFPKSTLHKAVCYTNTDFVLQSDYTDCVFDMELAYIAALGFDKLHSIKYVSDNLSLHAYHELTNGVE
jgi:hypothetical protein